MPMESRIISWPRFASGKARGKTAGATISLRTASRRRPPSKMAGSGDARADHTLELYAKHAAQQTRFALSCSLGKVRPDWRRWRVHRSVACQVRAEGFPGLGVSAVFANISMATI